MKILYVGLFCIESREVVLREMSKVGYSAAHQTFQKNIVRALSKYADVELAVAFPLGSYPTKSSKTIIHEYLDKDYCEIGYLNIPIVKRTIQRNEMEKRIYDWILKNNDEEKSIVIYDANNPFIESAVRAKKRSKDSKCKIIPIIPDLPGEFSIDYLNHGKIGKKWMDYSANKFYNVIGSADAYVLLTQFMEDVISEKNVKARQKPNIVIEGIIEESHISDLNRDISNQNKKIVLYAGELAKSVGIEEMIISFAQLDESMFELWICGRGEMEEFIKQEALKKSNIKYFGFVPKNELAELENQVDIYINPRQDKYSYTKYSFPSKNLECLKTGKPLIAYKLQGIPNEYDDVIFYPHDGSVDALREKIQEICQMTMKQKKEIRERQIEFCLQKTESVQGKKLFAFLKGLYL